MDLPFSDFQAYSVKGYNLSKRHVDILKLKQDIIFILLICRDQYKASLSFWLFLFMDFALKYERYSFIKILSNCKTIATMYLLFSQANKYF